MPLLLAVTGFWYWQSRPAVLAAGEARAALAGNTIEGGWGREGTGYRQFFGAGGDTLYAPAGQAARGGTWAVETDGRVCSRLEEWPERCHRVGSRDDLLYWIDDAGEQGFPFEVLPGRQISAEAAAGG